MSFAKYGLATAAVLAASFFTARTVTLRSATRKKPYMATVMVSMYKPDGTLSRTENRLYAVAVDGSQVDVFREALPDNAWAYPRKVRNVSTGLRSLIEPATKSVVTERMSKDEINDLVSVSGNCGAEAGAATRTILGYVTVRSYREMSVNENSSIRIESWRAPALDCYPLYERSDLGPKNGPSAYDVKEVLFVVEGDPPQALFKIPSGLDERSPSQMNSEFEHLFPGHRMYLDGGAKADRRYLANRPS